MREITEHEIRGAMEATHGNVTHAAARLGISRVNFIGHAARKGINVSVLRNHLRAQMFAARPVMAAPATTQESGDRLPSARSVVSDTLVDLSCAAMEIYRLQGELEEANRIIASLTASLEAVGAHLEAA
jgi:hypothetical protein